MRRGLSRIEGCLAQFPVSKSTWWAKVKTGQFPPPIKLTERTTAWKNSDLDELEDLLAQGLDWRVRQESKAA